MRTLETFAYRLGVWSVGAQEMLTPKKNWVIPFVLGVAICWFV